MGVQPGSRRKEASVRKLLRLTKHAQLSKFVWQLADGAFQGVRGHRHKYHDPYINTRGRAGRWRPCDMMYRLFFCARSDPRFPHRSRSTTLFGSVLNKYDVVKRVIKLVRSVASLRRAASRSE